MDVGFHHADFGTVNTPTKCKIYSERTMYTVNKDKNKSKHRAPKSAARFVVFLFLMVFAASVFPQARPYIKDAVTADNFNKSSSDPFITQPHLLCTFKLFNSDTVPFYLWVYFENRGKLKHVKYGEEFSGVRLVDLELRYKNALGQQMVKKFPDNKSDTRVKKRFGGAWLGGGRSKKSKLRDEPIEGAVADDTVDRGGRRDGASEITFWKEDAQTYYEMELWGALYAPDVDNGVTAGGYRDVVNFEIEVMK